MNAPTREAGFLFAAPPGTVMDDQLGDWVPLGWADDSCHLGNAEEGPVADALLKWSLGGGCVRMSIPVDAMSASTFWLLFHRRHPRLSRIRAAYRRKVRRRRGTRR